jgi:uroporphyrinogen decarboxylase
MIKDMYWEGNPHPPFANVKSIDEILSYPIPNMDDFDGAPLDREIREHEEFALCTGINAAIFHNLLYLCGQENGLCLIKQEPDLAKAIIDFITVFWVAYLERILDVADGRGLLVENCNDFGTQHSMFISPEDFRFFFKPTLRSFCEIAHRRGVFYIQHSCGDVAPILDDYVEFGADVLNPIQVLARDMNLATVVNRYRGRIAFYGGIDTQLLLPRGPAEAIQAAVLEAVTLFGSGGGFILSGSQGLMDDIPLAHAAAMLDCRLRTF